MSLPADFVGRLETIPTSEVVKIINRKDRPHIGINWGLKNEGKRSVLTVLTIRVSE